MRSELDAGFLSKMECRADAAINAEVEPFENRLRHDCAVSPTRLTFPDIDVTATRGRIAGHRERTLAPANRVRWRGSPRTGVDEAARSGLTPNRLSCILLGA